METGSSVFSHDRLMSDGPAFAQAQPALAGTRSPRRWFGERSVLVQEPIGRGKDVPQQILVFFTAVGACDGDVNRLSGDLAANPQPFRPPANDVTDFTFSPVPAGNRQPGQWLGAPGDDELSQSVLPVATVAPIFAPQRVKKDWPVFAGKGGSQLGAIGALLTADGCLLTVGVGDGYFGPGCSLLLTAAEQEHCSGQGEDCQQEVS